VVDENLLYRVFTLGAKAYDVRDNDGMTLATIKRGWFKRLISFGWWQDYDIKIKYKEYETDEFKKYLVSLTDFVHMQSNIRNKKMPTVNPSDVLRGR
jgi:hypothetical protein